MSWLPYGCPGPLARVGPPDVSEILPGLLVGEFPRPEDIGWLREEHRVGAVFNLQDDEDLVAKGLDRGYSLASACRLLKSRRAGAPYLRLLHDHFGEEPA